MFDPKIKIGDALSEDDVNRIFECQPQKGIRLSNKNRAIIIVAKSMKDSEYVDTWDGDILYYTGTNASADAYGNQTLNGPGNNNGRLKAVWDNPEATTIYLFEKYATNECTYKGVVSLAKEPYQAPRESNPSQLVWKFPLKLVSVDLNQLDRDFETLESAAAEKSEGDLKNTVKKKLNNPHNLNEISTRTANVTVYRRDPEISAYVKARAHGKCDLCGNPAPFIRKNGLPYLESHHIKWMSKGGKDIPKNMAALCPNCHRKMHTLNLEEDCVKLLKKYKFD